MGAIDAPADLHALYWPPIPNREDGYPVLVIRDDKAAAALGDPGGNMMFPNTDETASWGEIQAEQNNPIAPKLADGIRLVPEPRVYEQALKPLVERYYDAATELAELPPIRRLVSDGVRLTSRMDALREAGDLLADALGVAAPDWDAMRDLAGGAA